MTMLLVLSLTVTAAIQLAASPIQVQGAGEQQTAAETTPRTASQHTGAGGERQICRRQTRIGTLAGTETICRTAAEWQALARGTRESWQQVQGTFGSTTDRGRGLVCQPNGVGC